MSFEFPSPSIPSYSFCRLGAPQHFGLSLELGQEAEAVGKGGEGRGRRKATAAGWMEEAKEGGREKRMT